MKYHNHFNFTSRITLDYRSKEPDTPVTPEAGKEFSCASPPTTKFLDSMGVNAEVFVIFYIRSSTTGSAHSYGILCVACDS